MRAFAIDAVDISRFNKWQLYQNKTLHRIFSPDEIKYCRAIPAKSAERFAARFAAKEAAYKALSSLCDLPAFALIAPHVCVTQNTCGKPELTIAWTSIINNAACLKKMRFLKCSVTLTHTKHTAIACVWLI